MMLPKKANVLFKFKGSIVEFKSENHIHSMPSGLQYLVAKELTRIDVDNSKDLEYDYIRIVKQGKEIIIDLLNSTYTREKVTGKYYNYMYVEIQDIVPTDKRDGNYERLAEENTRERMNIGTFSIRPTRLSVSRKLNNNNSLILPRVAHSHR